MRQSHLMDAIFRAVRKSPSTVSGKPRHTKLGEGWGEYKEPVNEGITFYMKYLGSTLVEELPEDESYGDGISSLAVQSIVAMAKSVGRKLKKISLTISPLGICMADLMTKDVMFDLSIYRISFCTADKFHDRVFAFIARNATNETMECHAYFCTKRKLAQAVTLTVSQAFCLAQEKWKNIENNQIESTDDDSGRENHKTITKMAMQSNTVSVTETLKKDPTSQAVFFPFESSSGSSKTRIWQEFSDEEDKLEDDFSRLAQHRGRLLPSFSTDLCQEDVDEGVKQYMEGQSCFEEFSRQPSIEDLFNLLPDLMS